MFNLIKRAKDGTTATLSTTAAIVVSADNNRGRVIIQNADASIVVRVGDANITSTTGGVRLAAGESITFYTRGNIYAVAASGTPVINILAQTIASNSVKNLKYKAVTVGDTATVLLPRDTGRVRAIVQNLASSTVTVGNGNVALGAGGINLAQYAHVILDGTDPIYAAGPGTNEVQTVTVTGSPTGGTFKLTYAGQETGTINHNAAGSTVQTALRALSTIGSTGCSVTGSGPYSVTFTGPLANTNVALLTLSTNSLTGGTSPSVTITEATAGASATYSVTVNYETIN